MEPLLDDFDFDCALNQQKRLDRLNQMSSNSNHHFHGMHNYIDDQVHHQANVILRKQTTKNNLATYLHACCLFPVISTFVSAIKKGHFNTWPGLTTHLITKHLKKSIHTAKGHLRQEFKNLQSTNYKDKLREIQQNLTRLKAQHPDVPLDTILQSNVHHDFFPSSDSPNLRTNCVIYSLFPTAPTGLGYTDLTGRFSYRSALGNEYIFIGYHYDANVILALPIPNRKSLTIIKAWKTMHATFAKSGVAPDTYIG